jgi:hypothetical protein
MVELLGADGNGPFAVALLVMFVIAVLEGVMTLFGAGLSGLIDGLLPEVDLDADLADGNALSRLLGWLRVGQVPVLMLLVVFLTAFGLIGLFIQSTARDLLGGLLPAGLAAVPAFALALPVMRGFGGLLGRVMPKDETEAVSEASLVGRVAVVTLGEARVGSPAEAKVRDGHGQTHYVMVEPHDTQQAFAAGSAVLLVEHRGARFAVIAADNPNLTE